MAAADDVPEELICPICRAEFQNPVILECHHSFCRKCIDELIYQTHVFTTFNCPVCKTITSTKRIQTSFPVEQMREVIRKNKPPVPFYPNCLSHEQEELRFYYRQCRTTVCRDCAIIRAHKTHDIDDIVIAASDMRSELAVVEKGAKRDITDLQDKATRINQWISDIRNEREQASANCIRRSNELKSVIDTLAESAMDAIREKFNSELERPALALKRIESKLDDNSDFLNTANELRSFDDYSFVSSCDEVIKMRRKTAVIDGTLPELPRLSHTDVFRPGKTDATELYNMLGMVLCQSPVTPIRSLTDLGFSKNESSSNFDKLHGQTINIPYNRSVTRYPKTQAKKVESAETEEDYNITSNTAPKLYHTPSVQNSKTGAGVNSGSKNDVPNDRLLNRPQERGRAFYDNWVSKRASNTKPAKTVRNTKVLPRL